jgi:hypothetical protein
MLDVLNKIATEGHLVLIGTIFLAVAFAIVLIFKSPAGKWWGDHKEIPKKRSASEDRFNKRRYGRTILDIPEKKKKPTNQKQGVRGRVGRAHAE